MRPNISIIVPALDEEELIAATLGALSCAPVDEIIVVDGGSSDATVEIALRFTRRVISAQRGRASQMNAGASIATCDVLIFLHADCVLPEGALGMVREAFADGHTGAAAFDIAIDHAGMAYRLIERVANIRSRITRVPYGDQALCVRRDLFNRMGGYAAIPIMEDVELGLRLRREARVRFMRPPVRVSARRWLREGPLYTTIRDWRLAASYLILGTSPEKLAAHYGQIR